MAFGFLTSGAGPQDLLIRVPLFLVALTLHEFAHAAVADRLGDDTPRRHGLLTLNPVPYAMHNPIGTLMLLFGPFGWWSVPINDQNVRPERWGPLAVNAAGITMNFFLALIAAVLIVYLPMPSGTQSAMHLFFLINLWLMVFNLMPIPGLDGWNMISNLLPRQWQPTWQGFGVYTVLILIPLVMIPGILAPVEMLLIEVRQAIFWVISGGKLLV